MKTFKLISKIALLLVIFGFFQPVACNQQGFELAETLFAVGDAKSTIAAIGLYVTFFAAALSILYTLILLITKKNICSSKVNTTDFILLLLSIAGGLTTFFCLLSDFSFDVLDQGFYFIIAGWILSFIFSVIKKK